MTEELVFTKKIAKSGKGFLVWIPKNVVDYLYLTKESYVIVSICRLEKGKSSELCFTKRVAKSGRGFLLWIPKDVSDYLQLDGNSYCEFRLKKLGGNNA